jgi:pyruvate dehydrogenase E2 component (dihydrolipoamide acetyltransferase)
MAEFLMPSLGADMAAGTLIAWRVQPGAAIKRGDIIAEVETDKGLIEIECFETGIVEKLAAEPGAKLPVGALMAVIKTDGAPSGAPATPSPAIAAPAPIPIAVSPPEFPPPAPMTARHRASPLARKLAAELGVDLATVEGTGPGGVIERADIERATAGKEVAPATIAGASETGAQQISPPLSVGGYEGADKGRAGMRRAIAAAMSKSKREIPHYYLQTRMDMSRALAWLEAENAKRPIADRLLPVVMTLKAIALALRDVPEMNGFWIAEEHRVSDAIHIGFAISMKGGGLVAPAIRDVDKQSLDQLMAALRDLIPRARAGRLRSSEMTDATITLTNLGDLGVEAVFGVIYPPQVALVGIGKAMPQPWAQDGMLGVHPVAIATLAADHRATDGHRGGHFLEALNRRLQNPEQL